MSKAHPSLHLRTLRDNVAFLSTMTTLQTSRILPAESTEGPYKGGSFAFLSFRVSCIDLQLLSLV